MKLGIIGLPYVGKTTLFNVLTRGTARTGTFGGSAGNQPNMGVVSVPDRRVDALTELYKPKKTIFANVEYVDIVGFARGAAKTADAEGFLAHARRADAFVHVLRTFKNDSVTHPDGSVDAVRDYETLQTELILTDLITVENRLERLQKSMQRNKRPEDAAEKDLMERCKALLEEAQPIAGLDLAPDQQQMLRGFQFLTLKPQLVVENVDEDQLSGKDSVPAIPADGVPVVPVSGKIEEELAQLDPAEAAELMSAYGITESGLERMIRQSYETLGLMSFFTVGEDEVRAWTIRRGTPAVEAAGAIHTDIQRGFIRAEVVAYDDLMASGNYAKAREKGLVRLEGKDYVVKDGDICNFRFNI